MYILVAYDVSTSSHGGEKRLRHVAKICQDYGQRVQNSVFECKVDPSQYVILKNRLISVISLEKDSIRIYHLHRLWQKRIEKLGLQQDYNIDDPLIL